MKQIISFFRLIRLGNIIIIGLILLFIQAYIIEETVFSTFINHMRLEYLFLIITTVMISAAGYIINNVYDLESDKINNKNIIINQDIRYETALVFYYLFNTISIVFASLLCYMTNQFYLLFTFIIYIYLLHIYSKIYQHRFLLGNFIISFLSAISIINVFIFSPLDLEDYNIFIIIIYSCFAFLITFVRELIKDLEDIDGDKIMLSDFVFMMRKKTSKSIANILLILVLLGLFIIQYIVLEYNYWKINYISILYLTFIILLVIISIFRILSSKTIKDFKNISYMMKFIIIFGLISIPITSLFKP